MEKLLNIPNVNVYIGNEWKQILSIVKRFIRNKNNSLNFVTLRMVKGCTHRLLHFQRNKYSGSLVDASLFLRKLRRRNSPLGLGSWWHASLVLLVNP